MIVLSYNINDIINVEDVVNKLINSIGVDEIILDTWSNQPGDMMSNKIYDSVNLATHYCIFISRNTIIDSTAPSEWENIAFLASTEMCKIIIVRIDQTKIPSLFIKNKLIDMTKINSNAIVEEMIGVLKNTGNLKASNRYKNISKLIKIIEILALIPVIAAAITLGQFFIEMRQNYDVNILREAEQAYLNYNVEYSIMLYKKLGDNKIALNNLGYIYSKGRSGVKDLNKAEEYYLKSSMLGNNMALQNLIIFYFENGLEIDELIKVFDIAYVLNDSKLMNLIDEVIIDEQVRSIYGINSVDDFYFMKPLDKVDILEKVSVSKNIEWIITKTDYYKVEEWTEDGSYNVSQKRVDYKEPFEVLKPNYVSLISNNFIVEEFQRID